MNIIDKVLKEVEEYCNTHARTWSIPKEEGEYLYNLILKIRPKNILELGTSVGYSTLWLAKAAEHIGAKITTIEHNKKKSIIANENFKKADVTKIIRLIEGDCDKAIVDLKEQKFGFVFIDHAKKYYLKDLRLLFNILEDNATIATDNAITHKESLAEYLDYVNKNFHTRLINVGNGIELTTFKKQKTYK